MPTIAPRTVHAVRAVALWGVRAVAIALALRGTIQFVQRFVFGLITGEWTSAYKAWSQGVGESHAASGGLTLVLVGLALALLSRRLVRWAIPVPDTGCPRCDYAAAESTCPECGLDQD